MSLSHSKVILISLGFALSGFVLELAIVLAMGFGNAWQGFLTPVLVSLIGLILAAVTGSHFYCRYVFREKSAVGGSILLGCFVGWFALWTQVLFGSSVEFIRHVHVSGAFEAYIFRPVFWVIWLGSVPSWILGGLFGWFIGRRAHENI